MIKRNKKLIMIISTILTIIFAISISYAFFYYGKEGSAISLESGNISLNFEEDANFLTLHDTYPMNDNVGMISTNYYDFTVSGSRGKNDDIYYEIQIEQVKDKTLSEEYIKVYLTDQEDNELKFELTDQEDEELKTEPILLNKLETSKYNKNRIIYNDYIYDENQAKNYRLRI